MLLYSKHTFVHSICRTTKMIVKFTICKFIFILLTLKISSYYIIYLYVIIIPPLQLTKRYKIGKFLQSLRLKASLLIICMYLKINTLWVPLKLYYLLNLIVVKAYLHLLIMLVSAFILLVECKFYLLTDLYNVTYILYFIIISST